MNLNQKRRLLIVIPLLAVSTLALVSCVPQGKQTEKQGTIAFDNAKQYTLYIGTNDKDTYEQIIPTDQVRQIIDEICSRYTRGWTVTEARGAWLDDKNVLTQEITLVYRFMNTDEESIVSIMREVLVALNQNCILMERRDADIQFFSGGD